MIESTIEEPGRLQARRAVLAGVALMALGGCTTTRVDGGAAAWAVVALPDAELKPANADPSRLTRVVVLASEDSPSAPRTAGLASVATAGLEAALGAGGVEVVERRLADRLDAELKLAEMSGAGSYGGPDVADYAIRVVMGNARVDAKYEQASQTKIAGRTINRAAGFTSVATSAMTVRIYQVPSLRVVQSIPVEGRHIVMEQPSAGDPVPLLRTATDRGIGDRKADVLNAFAPKGYITERRVLEKKSIFRVQLGRQTGAKSGDTIEIWTLQKVGSAYDEVQLGKGVMSDIVGAEGSWILVDDERVAARVRNGDFVKVRHSRSATGVLRDLLKSL